VAAGLMGTGYVTDTVMMALKCLEVLCLCLGIILDSVMVTLVAQSLVISQRSDQL
jgi:hypothetical protein